MGTSWREFVSFVQADRMRQLRLAFLLMILILGSGTVITALFQHWAACGTLFLLMLAVTIVASVGLGNED